MIMNILMLGRNDMQIYTYNNIKYKGGAIDINNIFIHSERVCNIDYTQYSYCTHSARTHMLVPTVWLLRIRAISV
jgi:hypothetical protein